MEENKLICEEAETADQSLSQKRIEKDLKDDFEEEEKPGYPTMDNLLNRLGYTNYHLLVIFGCCSFFFSCGAQLYAFNLLIPVFNALLKLNYTTHLIMNSICYIGYAFGSFFVGLSTKYFNRRVPLLTCITVYSIFTVLIVLYEDTLWICMCRFIIGTCVGMITSLYLSNMSEYLPINMRELTIGIVLCNYILGIIFYIYCFKLIMPNYQKLDQWRLILLLIAIPSIGSCIFALFIVRDSPRLLLNKDKFPEAVSELRNLTRNTDVVFTLEEEDKLKREVIACKAKNIEFSFSMLFSDKFRFLTIINLLLLMTTSMTYVSNFFSLPLILYKESKHSSQMFDNIIMAQSFSIPAIIIAALIAGLPNLGRKYTIILGFSVCFLVALFSSIFQKGLVVACSLINFFIMVSYFLSKVYLIESFPSKLRDHGMSVIFVAARLGESLSPSICELSFKLYIFGPLVFIAGLASIGIIVAILIPFETRGEALDSKI
jgi:MFS family permease